MKFGYLHNTGRKYNTSAFIAEKRSSSPGTIEATLVSDNRTDSHGCGRSRGCFAETTSEFGVKRSGR